MKFKIYLIILLTTVLSACGGSSSGSKSIDVLTVSDSIFTLDGSYRDECDAGVIGQPEDEDAIWQFSGDKFTSTFYMYSPGDGSCSGTVTVDGVFTGTITKGGTFMITGWSDTGAPLAQDGLGNLSDTAVVTLLTITITSVTGNITDIDVGDELALFIMVDDTVPSTPVLYIADYVGADIIAAPYPRTFE